MLSESDSVCSSPTISELNPNRRNVLIVGDVGVGKSSLVNLISGENIAVTSSGARSCTLQSKEHIAHIEGVEFALHDTAGMHEAHANMKKSEHLGAILQAYSLISKLERTGGISLLVFCMKGGRISVTTQQTYNLFVEILCSRQVPIVIVVTHLETHADNMEQWWTDNEKDIHAYGLKSDRHACITATRGYKNVYAEQYEQSRETVRKLLLDSSGGVAYKEDKASWVKRVIRWLSPKHHWNDLSSAKDLKKKLVKKCGFSKDDAEAVATQIQQTRATSLDVPEESKSWFGEKLHITQSISTTSCVSLPSSLPSISYASHEKIPYHI